MPNRRKQFYYTNQTSWPVIGLARPEGVLPFVPVQGWGAVDSRFGVRMEDFTGLPSWQTWIGAAPAQYMAFAAGSTWANLISYAQTQVTAFASLGPIDWSQGIPPTATLAEVAAGVHDASLRTLADIYLAARPADTRILVRPLWEQQLSQWPWYCVGSEAAYIAAFRRITQVFLNKSTKFRFCWCPNIGNTYDPSVTYPGDAYVDVIGMDFYFIPGDGTDMVAAWRFKVEQTYGLNWAEAFARSHSKPLSIPEWGIGVNNAQFYVSSVRDFITDNADIFAYHNYYNADISGDPNFQDRLDLNQYPATGARMQTEFGPSPPANLETVDINGSGWGLTAATRTTGVAGSKGTNTATRLLETTANSGHAVARTTTKVAAAAHRYRIFADVKPVNGRAYSTMQVAEDAFGSAGVVYNNMANGNVATFFVYGVTTSQLPFGYPLRNGYWRVGMEVIPGDDAACEVRMGSASADGTASFVGDATKGIDIDATVMMRRVATS